MNKSSIMVACVLLILGVASANAQINFLDTMDSVVVPASDDVTDNGYTEVEHFRDACPCRPQTRNWFYNPTSPAPGKMYTTADGNGNTNSAVFRTAEVLTSDTWTVSVEGTGSSNGSAEWITGVVAAQDLALDGDGKLANGWAEFQWFNLGGSSRWLARTSNGTIDPVGGLPSYNVNNQEIQIAGKADGSFDFTYDDGNGPITVNHSFGGLDSTDMKKFGMTMASASGGQMYTGEFDNLRATVIPEPGTLGLLAVASLLVVAARRRKYT